MMEQVRDQYEIFPYPFRRAEDETKRLVAGSPSDLAEIDHYLFAGARDWSQPFRVLVAGGGTGDGLIQLAQQLAWKECPAKTVYLDLSTAAREIAEARAKVRGLDNIQFETGSLLDAGSLGTFDYIDCCGVLHHLPGPGQGFGALARALKPDGGMGIMVYGRIGRTGVYEAQHALRLLSDGLSLSDRVDIARRFLADAPETNWLRRNTWIGDHQRSDAELVDLLLHFQDRAYSVAELYTALDGAHLELVSFIEPVRYDPGFYLDDDDLTRRSTGLGPRQRAELAELTAGNLKVHIAYVKPADRSDDTIARPAPNMVPLPHRLDFSALAKVAASGKPLPITLDGLHRELSLPPSLAGILNMVDGQRSLQQIMTSCGQSDWFAFAQSFKPVYRTLSGLNKLLLRKSEQAGS